MHLSVCHNLRPYLSGDREIPSGRISLFHFRFSPIPEGPTLPPSSFRLDKPLILDSLLV